VTSDLDELNKDPLTRWANAIEELTLLRRDTDVRQVYAALLEALDQKEFDGKLLCEEASLLLASRPKSSLRRPSQAEKIVEDEEEPPKREEAIDPELDSACKHSVAHLVDQ